MLLRIFSKDDAHEFKPLLSEIEEDPGSPLGRATFWIVVSVFGFAILWTILGQMDIVISARGKIIPVGESKTIQSLNGGVVGQILVQEGDFVKQGQPIVIIDPSTTEPALKSYEKNLSYVELEQKRLQASAYGKRFTGNNANSEDSQTQNRLYNVSSSALEKQISAKYQMMKNIDAQIQEKVVEQNHTQELLDINKQKEARLHQVQDIIARDDYERILNEVLTEESRIKSLSYEIQQLEAEKQQCQEEISYIRQNYNSNMLMELSDKQKQMAQLTANLEETKFRNSRQTLTAPVSGYVHELFVHTEGGVVTPAQKLLTIVPADVPLVVEATVLNKDIGFVKPGMSVAIKLDTYDFQKYGTVNGEVIHIDNDSRDDAKLGPVYKVLVKPLQRTLLVDGKDRLLSSGLSLTSEIKVGKRRIIEFFIYPIIKHLNEGMSVR